MFLVLSELQCRKNRISMNSLVGEGELYSNMKFSPNDSCDVYLLLAWQVLRLFYARLHAVNFLTHCAPMAGSFIIHIFLFTNSQSFRLNYILLCTIAMQFNSPWFVLWSCLRWNYSPKKKKIFNKFNKLVQCDMHKPTLFYWNERHRIENSFGFVMDRVECCVLYLYLCDSFRICA